MNLRKETVKKYFRSISKVHEDLENKSGFERHDRNIFIRDFLKPLGYKLENILDDVSQKVGMGSRIPDIRLFGNTELKNKQAHSQFVIETKDFNLLRKNIDNIDFLQLKRYIKANQSKIRLICSTDYVTLFIFNATQIKQDSRINLNNLENISEFETKIFKSYLYYKIEFDNLSPRDMKYINTIRYDVVFEHQSFINPEDYESTNSISEIFIRQSFISSLYKLMIEFKNDVEHDFFDRINSVYNNFISSPGDILTTLNKLLYNPKNIAVRNYFLWGSEMNYISDFITNADYKMEREDIKDYLENNEYQEAFILTSVYNLINKTFFLRILEDIATHNTKFIDGAYNFRYLSNGILNEKYKTSEEELIEYLKNVYEFQKPDLRKYSFLLKKDIYSWVLEFVSSHNLLSFIRLFNDINFKKLSQDILGDIYEHYLEQGNGEEQEKTYRRLLGQYYTPKPIVRLMWMLVRDVLKKVNKRDLYEADKPNLNILDPACGSGTFISEAVLHINSIASNVAINRDGKVFGFIKNRNQSNMIENSIYGFELNPLSKSIADINMFFSLIQAYGGDSLSILPVRGLKVFRTNSYDMQPFFEARSGKQHQNLFLYSEDVRSSITGYEEIINAKQNKYNIIIGNPPYGYIKPTEFMKEKLLPYAYAENNFDVEGKEISFSWENANFNGNVPDNEKNKGKLTDMYAFFFGVADLLVEDDGIVCFITSNTYLTIPTYKWLRKYWLENYNIHYIINFNNISEKSNSMFAPEAGIATSIIVMSKGRACNNNEIKFLDLSDIDNIPDKYDVLCDIYWNERRRDKNDIQKFIIKNFDKINFKCVCQQRYLDMNDYILSRSDYDELLDIIENQSKALSTYSNLNTGVDVGDLNYLVDSSEEGIKDKILNYVFKGELSGFNRTSRGYLKGNLGKGKINRVFEKRRVLPFIYQKHMDRFSYSEKYYTYLDNNILWRSRLQNLEDIFDNPITSKIKLCVLEKRNIGEIYAFVTDELILPQHGGRFAYLVPDSSLSVEDIYILAGLINSKVVQVYYKFRQLGVKDVLVKDLNKISDEYRERLIKITQEIHLFVRDKMNLENNNLIFESKWFINEILPKIVIRNLAENSDYWEIETKGEIFPDYSIYGAKIDENDESIIILNSDLRVKCKDIKFAKQIYKQYLDGYIGNIMETSLNINITKIVSLEEYKNIINMVNVKYDLLIKELNNITYQIYEFTEEEVKLLNSFLSGNV